MIFASDEKDMFGHKKLGGIGDIVSANGLQELSPKYNNGRRINVIAQRLSYLVRCGDPDAVDSIVPMAYGNIALDLHPGEQVGPHGLPPQRRIRPRPRRDRDQPEEDWSTSTSTTTGTGCGPCTRASRRSPSSSSPTIRPGVPTFTVSKVRDQYNAIPPTAP